MGRQVYNILKKFFFVKVATVFNQIWLLMRTDASFDIVPLFWYTNKKCNLFLRVLMEKFIAYQGERFTVEWYFDSRGKSEALEYYLGLPLAQRNKALYLFASFGDIGKISNTEKFRYEGNQIYAFKASHNRFLCFFFDGRKIIVTSAYKKQSAKMPAREKQKALKAKENYKKRHKAGSYYE